MVNITVLKKERSNYDLANNRLQAALEMGNMAWWEWDFKSGEVSMHEKKATMLGYTVQEFPTNVYKICELIHPDDYEATMTTMRDYIEGKTLIYDVVYRIKAKSGDYKYYYDRGGIVERDAKGNPLKMIGLVIDVTKIEMLKRRLDK